MGRVAAVESTPPDELKEKKRAEHSHEPMREEGSEAHSSFDDSGPRPAEQYDDPEEPRPSSHEEGPPPQETPPEQYTSEGQSASGGGGYPPRRGPRGRRMSMRDRRTQRPRRRDYASNQPANYPERERPDRYGGESNFEGREERREERRPEPEMAPHKAASLREIRGQIERIRQALEGVLRDLNKVADQLAHAEREKDVAEEEIENLKDQLRRFHR